MSNRNDAPNSGPLNLIDMAIPFKVLLRSNIASNVKAYIIIILTVILIVRKIVMKKVVI